MEENGKLLRFVYHKGELVYERGEKEQTSYHQGAGTEAINRAGKIYYYHKDEQLSTALITDEQGAIKNTYRYDAFGNILDSMEQIENRIRYTGQQYDGITGQYYLRARYYNPAVGRFMQEDTYRGDGLNLYAYCANNPVTYYDPSGYAGTSPYVAADGGDGGAGDKLLEGAINGGQPMGDHQVIDDKTSLPATKQTPNSSADLLNPDGSVKQRRYYDEEGRAKMDIDFNHSDDGTHVFPHIHLWDWGKKPPRQDSRR